MIFLYLLHCNYYSACESETSPEHIPLATHMYVHMHVKMCDYLQIHSHCTVALCTYVVIFNSYTMAARDFADIYAQSPRAVGVYVSKIPSSCGISDIYHLGRTHLIGERTNENSSRLFYTVASEN